MIKFYTENIDEYEKHIVFIISLPGREPVFMSVEISNYAMKHHGIVIVNSEKFIKLWRSNPTSDQQSMAYGSPETWRKSKKYEKAVAGFSLGRTSPVPLAKIFYSPTTPYVAIDDGVTRTIWLLSNNCVAFPIKCELSDAPELFLLTAVEGSSFYTIGEDGLIKASVS